MERLRLKFNKDDIDKLFFHLDVDKDDHVNYKEFCELTEEKRRNIDPFSAAMKAEADAQLNQANLKQLQSDPYANMLASLDTSTVSA